MDKIQRLMQWQALITLAISLGVKSWEKIKALGEDAGLEDDVIEENRLKWEVLVADVRRAAGQ